MLLLRRGRTRRRRWRLTLNDVPRAERPKGIYFLEGGALLPFRGTHLHVLERPSDDMILCFLFLVLLRFLDDYGVPGSGLRPSGSPEQRFGTRQNA